MANKSLSSLPDAIKKRDLLYSPRSNAQELESHGKDFESKGAYNDAIDFYVKAKSPEALKGLLTKCIQDGDSFLALKIIEALGSASDFKTEVLNCAQRAKELGKLRYAISAYESVGEEERAAQIRESLSDQADIQAELESDVFIPE